MERRPHGAPASSPACTPPSSLSQSPANSVTPCRTTWARSPTHHARLRRGPARTPALQIWRALTYGAPAPWSAGVLAGLHPILRPLASLRPTASPPAEGRGPGGPPTMPASGGGRRGRRRSKLARPDIWNAGPMERRRPRRPAPHPPSLISQSPADSVTPCRRTGARRPTHHARLRRWPARTPALQNWRAIRPGVPGGAAEAAQRASEVRNASIVISARRATSASP